MINDCRAQLQVLVQVQSSAQKLKTSQKFLKFLRLALSVDPACKLIDQSLTIASKLID